MGVDQRITELERDNQTLKRRVGELNVQLMRKSAEASEASETLRRWRLELELLADQKGHNLCWARIPRLLKATVGHTGEYPDPENVSPEEFAQGCVVYHGDLFGKCGIKLVVAKEGSSKDAS